MMKLLLFLHVLNLMSGSYRLENSNALERERKHDFHKRNILGSFQNMDVRIRRRCVLRQVFYLYTNEIDECDSIDDGNILIEEIHIRCAS